MLPQIKMQSGTCPHGMPLGACPICSGMNAGGGSSITTPRKAGEMSWSDCYFEGMLMKKAAEAKQEVTQLNQQNFVLSTLLQNKMIQAVSQKFAQGVQFIQNILAKPLETFSKNIIQPMVNIAENIVSSLKNNALTQTLTKAFEGAKHLMANITDKLAAIFGEIKNALNAGFEKHIENAKKKLAKFFGFVNTEMEQGEDEDELKRILDLKTVKEKLRLLLTNKRDLEND